MSFFENTRKPVGFSGKIMVAMMNFGHSAMAAWGLHFLQPAPDAMVLDCGCGGGANIKRLLKKCPEGIVKGIDYSPVSVEKSKKVNAAAIAEGRCTVLQGSVADMIFAGDWFDAAFETVYFWPDLPRCFREVYRVLKPGGTLLICNESNGDTDKDKKWTEIIGGMTIYKDAELKTYLEQAGFHEVQIHKKKGCVHSDCKESQTHPFPPAPQRDPYYETDTESVYFRLQTGESGTPSLGGWSRQCPSPEYGFHW